MDQNPASPRRGRVPFERTIRVSLMRGGGYE